MTPYDTIFAQPEFEAELFPGISADAETHGMDMRSVDSFLQMPGTSALIEKIAPAGALDGGPIAGITALSYHGYHFWREGKHVDVMDEPDTRALLDPATQPIGDWTIAAPAAAGYVTLPANLVWAKTDGGTPESLHGFFYALSPAVSHAESSTVVMQARLDVLLALGVRNDRAGVTAIEVTVPLPAPPPGHFGDIDARDDGADFANVLPGGELRGLYAVTNAGEVLKMVSRVLHFLVARGG